MQYKMFRSFFVFLCVTVVQFSDTNAYAQEVIPGEYLVTYHKGSQSSARSFSGRSLGFNEVKHFNLLDTTLVRLPKGRRLDKKTVKDLKNKGFIKSIEPNFRVKALSTPNDPKFTDLWGMNNTGQTGGRADIDIDAPEAWNLSQGSSDVIVAVLDTGVLYTHPDLVANIWTNSREIANNGIDDDGNGVIDDVHGLNAVADSGDPKDDNGHGTHCAGTIAGVGNNGQGVAGVSWKSRIMALKFLDSSGSGSLSDAIQGIQYAIAMKQRGENIKVISNSWGGSGYSASLENAINTANTNGILFVVAAGNDSNDNDAKATYPANYSLDNVVSVAALDDSGNLASFSNFGVNTVHVAAPGVSILSTYLNNGYALLSGTSMATPHVSGLSALILANQNLTPLQVKTKLMSSVKPLSSLLNLVKSGGLVSAYRALSDTSVPLPPQTATNVYKNSSKDYSWNSDLGTRISTSDDAYIIVNTTYNIPFYGSNYKRFAVSTNGRIQPMAENDPTPTQDDYASSLYKGMSAYSADLVSSNLSSDGGVWSKDLGSSLQITWVSMPYEQANSNSADREIRFRIVLKSSGEVEYTYNDTRTGNAAYDYGKNATISISPLSSGSGSNLIVSSNTSSESLIGNQKAMLFSSNSKFIYNDFDGDGKSDLIVWRPSSGMYYISPSSSQFNKDATLSYQLGLPGDKPKVGDFDGDKKADLAVFRPSNGTWYFLLSSTSYSSISSVQWGLSGDVPLLGDVEGDGVSDLIVYRASSSAFYTLLSSSGFNRNAALSGARSSARSIALGGPANDPVIGDANGDGADDLGVVWQLVRFWTVKDSNNSTLYSLPWGMPGDTPIFCNVDSDKISDRMIVRVESNNTLSWYAALGTGTGSVVTFGSLGDTPTCKMDSDGDSLGDYIVFRNNSGNWYIKNSSSNTVDTFQFGLPGDIPMIN